MSILNFSETHKNNFTYPNLNQGSIQQSKVKAGHQSKDQCQLIGILHLKLPI